MTLPGFLFYRKNGGKMSRMEDLKRHFEEGSREFDGIIRRLILYYPQKYMEKWISFKPGSVGGDEAENKWIPKYYHEDRPASLTAHLDMLNAAGFSSADVVWKYYNYAVYMAVR